jgi:hypothetical protein
MNKHQTGIIWKATPINNVLIKLWRDVRHSTKNRYFAFAVN